MKKTTITIMALALTSCTVKNYYQVYKTNVENGTVAQNEVLFEDQNCSVTYDLWTEGGDVGFSIYNKTDRDLTIHLSKSFFVMNGQAYEYFRNRSFAKSSGSGTAVTSSVYPYYANSNATKVTGFNLANFTTSFLEKPDLIVPPKTYINISEYTVSNQLYANCDMEKFPSRKEVKTIKFTKENSPFVFYNLITYSTPKDTIRFENKFYVSEITNCPSTEIFRSIDTSACGKRLETPVSVFKDQAPNKFYIKYQYTFEK